MGTIQIDGSTPKLTIGNATAEDATILFDGNAQDFYIALDDSADDLLIGLGSTVGTTPIIAIDENKLSTFSGAITVGVDDTGHDVKFFGATASAYMLWDESADDLILAGAAGLSVAGATATAALTASGIVKTDDTTEATSTTDGSLQTDGGLSVAKDTVLGDDLKLLSDSSVIAFGADGDTTFTHTDGTGLTLNSTNKLTFGDAASYINQSSDGVLTIAGEATIGLTASTAVTVSNDLKLNSDSAILSFGADSEVTLTHSHNAGLIFDSGDNVTLTLGTGGAYNTQINFDGNAHDFRLGLRDSGDTFAMGYGTTEARYEAFSVNSNKEAYIKGSVVDSGASEQAGAAKVIMIHENASALYVDVSDDATITPDFLTTGGSVFFVGTWASGGQGYRSAVYAGTYGHATIVKLADPTDSFDVAATDGKNIGVTSTTNSGVATLTNKSGVTLRVIVSAISGAGL